MEDQMPTPPPTIEDQIAMVSMVLHADIRDSTHIDGVHKGTIPEPEIRWEIECLQAALRTLLWAKRQPDFAKSGVTLTLAQRNELKGIEAAALAAEEPDKWLRILTETEKDFGVYDPTASSPRWQD